jgi:hypothetical protein
MFPKGFFAASFFAPTYYAPADDGAVESPSAANRIVILRRLGVR